MLSDEERAVLKTVKENYGLTSAEQKILVNLIEKQSKEIEGLIKVSKECIEEKFNNDQKWKDKIKAKIEEMDNIISKNEQIRFNGRYEHLHTLTEARIVKGELQSLLEKE